MSADHRAILRGVVAIGFFSIVGKLAIGAKEVMVAWRFGVSVDIDAYLFVFNLVNWPIGIWFSVLGVIVIPLEAKLHREAPDQLLHFRSELLAVTLLLGFALVGIEIVLLPWVVTNRSVGLPPSTVALALDLIPGVAWFALPGLLVALFSTWIMSSGRYANTLLESVPALAIMAAVAIVQGVNALVWGLLVGAIVQLAFLSRAIPIQKPKFSAHSTAWRPFFRGFGLVIVGQATMAVTTLVDQFFAAHLGEGAISALGYSGRILALINGIILVVASRATLPVFSRARAAGSDDLDRLATRWVATLGLLGVVVMAIGWIFAPAGVHLLYERGTFTASDTVEVMQLFRTGVLQLPFLFASLVLVSLHSSRGNYGYLVASGVLGLSVKVAAVWLLIETLGIYALPLSTAAMYAANALLLLLLRTR